MCGPLVCCLGWGFWERYGLCRGDNPRSPGKPAFCLHNLCPAVWARKVKPWRQFWSLSALLAGAPSVRSFSHLLGVALLALVVSLWTGPQCGESILPWDHRPLDSAVCFSPVGEVLPWVRPFSFSFAVNGGETHSAELSHGPVRYWRS